MNELLIDDNTYMILQSNPLKSWQHHYNKELKRILKNNPDLEKRFRSYMPKLPHMYGLPKVHKDGVPMRPIVSTIGSVDYLLAGWLAKLLSPCLNKIAGTHITNTLDFIERIDKVDLNDKLMVSYDVDSLFTNVPVTQCIEFLKENLDSLELDLPVSNNAFIDLLILCTSNCYFEFDDKYFVQNRGLPMGSPISPVLSNIYMEFYEKNHLPNVLPNDILWVRFVDDIFAVLPDSVDPKVLLNSINQASPSVKFKCEVEQEGKLAFLDTQVIRSPCNKPIFRVYRKPTHSNAYIHAYSCHSENVKVGVMITIFLRAYNICDPSYIDEEIRYISEVFKRLGYCDRFINQAHQKARKRFYGLKQNRERETRPTLVIPNIADNKIIADSIKEVKYDVVNKNNCTIGKRLKKKVKSDDNSGVIYRIKCLDCNFSYFGETNDLKRRVYQHKYSKRTGDLNNAIVKHIWDKDHRVDINQADVILRKNDTNTRKLLESMIINNTDNINIDKRNLNLDVFSEKLAISHIPSLRKLIIRLNEETSQNNANEPIIDNG